MREVSAVLDSYRKLCRHMPYWAMDKALNWFIKIWIGLVILLDLLALAVYFKLEGFWGGLANLQEVQGPFSIYNIITQMVLLSPAMLAWWWRDKRRAKKNPGL